MRPRSRCLPDGVVRPATLSAVARLAGVLVAAYAAIAGALFVGQEALLFPGHAAGAPVVQPAGWSLVDIHLDAPDGVRLRGHLVKPPGPPAPLLIYYGGNAEWSGALATEVAGWGARAVLLMDYRGYGSSDGTPSEASLVADALAAYDLATQRPDVAGTQVALVGRSLGSGVAVQVAAARRAQAVVLVTPFDSVRALAQARYPWLPVGWLLRHPFDSLARAGTVTAPALLLVAAEDRVIPPAHAWRLADAWGGPVERVAFAGRGHDDLAAEPGYARSIAAFLARHHGMPVRELPAAASARR